MMGGVDTVMPDKIVKRIVNGILVKVGLESLNSEQGICFGRWVMGEALFRGGCLENRETKPLFRAFMSMLVVFVVGMFFLGMFVLGILLAYSVPYPSVDLPTLLPILTFLGTLCSVSGVGLVVSLHRYRKKSRVEVTDEGVVFGGRLVRWGDVDDVKVWSESFREAEVEGSPVVGYGIYGYAIGRTMPSTVTYRSRKYVVLQFFHRNGMETVYFARQEYWPFVKAVSGILGKRVTVPEWLQKLMRSFGN
jgi:hypothetical protein